VFVVEADELDVVEVVEVESELVMEVAAVEDE